MYIFLATRGRDKIVYVSKELEATVRKLLERKYGGSWDLTRIGTAFHGVEEGIIVSKVHKAC